jgi:poly(3-hydroxybutyrate) depolymerase
MLYQLHEFQRAMLSPLTAWAQAASKPCEPVEPVLADARRAAMAAAYELLYRLGKDYEKPEFNIHQIVKDGHNIPIVEQTIIEKPFCRLLRFKRYATTPTPSRS